MDELNIFDYYCYLMCIILLMFMFINVFDLYGLVYSVGFLDRWFMVNWWWVVEIGVD